MKNSLSSDGKSFCVGLKQTMRYLKKNSVLRLYIAEDADTFVIRPVMERAKADNIEIKFIRTMKELGAMAKIDTGAAVAAEIVNL